MVILEPQNRLNSFNLFCAGTLGHTVHYRSTKRIRETNIDLIIQLKYCY